MERVGKMQETKTISFKGKNFHIIKGSMHPDYSFDTFDKEENAFRDKYWNIKEGDVVFDIGSSYGSYALTACAMGAKVYAFEPEKTVYNDLVTNIRINDWLSRCFPMNIGMWSSRNTVDMKSYAPHWPQFAITSDYQMDTVDHIAQAIGISKLDWIKMDIEGAEEHAIRGALETITKFRPKMIIECHNFLDAELENKVKVLLTPLNYSFESIKNDHTPSIMLIATPNK